MKRKWWFLIALLIVSLFVGSVIAYLSCSKKIPNDGKVKGVNLSLWWDSNCTNPMTEIHWNAVEPSVINYKYFYIKSESNVPINLGFYTSNKSPANLSMSLGMQTPGHPLDPDEVFYTYVTLQINPPTTGIENFSFDLTIIGEEVH